MRQEWYHYDKTGRSRPALEGRARGKDAQAAFFGSGGTCGASAK